MLLTVNSGSRCASNYNYQEKKIRPLTSTFETLLHTNKKLSQFSLIIAIFEQ